MNAQGSWTSAFNTTNIRMWFNWLHLKRAKIHNNISVSVVFAYIDKHVIEVVFFFFFFLISRVSSHHSRLDQNLTKGRGDKGKWSEASWWKQVTLFSFPPLSRQHLCRRCAFRKATTHMGFFNLGNRTQIDNYHQQTGHLQTAPTSMFKSIFFTSWGDKKCPFSCWKKTS